MNLFICRVLDEEEHVAVLFYEDKKRESMKALQHLEMIDDEADQFGIRCRAAGGLLSTGHLSNVGTLLIPSSQYTFLKLYFSFSVFQGLWPFWP